MCRLSPRTKAALPVKRHFESSLARRLLPLNAAPAYAPNAPSGQARARPGGHGASARLPCTCTGRRRCSNASPPPAPSEISSVRRQGSAPALARLGERRAVFSPLGVPAALTYDPNTQSGPGGASG
jgi:hypothetical protein